ncbi:MAG: M42 family metallopeptidase [Ruminococcaceae bacterium]|nr:M42 family metallopeptidase [Oscillospiraceae bacterium]
MKFKIDNSYLLACFKDLVEAPSPSGYCEKLRPVIERYASELGFSITYDNKDTPYLWVDGEDNSKTVMLSAHADTVGLVVYNIDGDGKIRINPIGGINRATLDGESVTIHTRDGKEYTGLILCRSHSTHAFLDALTMERSTENLIVILDERVSTKAEVEALGIRRGDYISVDPRCQITENGFVKSRFIDDKAAIACCFSALKYMKEHDLRPKYRTLFSFPYWEEMEIGAAYLPKEVSEFVAVDIGLISPNTSGNEYSVSICAKDAQLLYDYELTNRLISYAEKAECDYAVDVYLRYGSDANAARKAGNDVRAALFGMAVYGSHGMERTHIDGLCNTANLLLAYVLDI